MAKFKQDSSDALTPRGDLALPQMDLNLLKVFAAVYHHRQVTAAARQLDITPSAASNALARLRGHCEDQLFVRTQRGVVPTPFASRLWASVSLGMSTLHGGLTAKEEFDPARSEIRFRVNVADVGQLLMIGAVLLKISPDAPGIGVQTVDLPVREVDAALMRGDIHLAVGHLASLGKTLFRRKLVSERFVCVVSQHNKRLCRKLSVEDFVDATHIRYSPAAVSLSRINVEIDRFFHEQGRQQKVALEAAHAFGLSSIVAESGYVLTVPERLARHYARLNAVVIHPLPIRLPPFDISLYWHERDHRDAAHKWFRTKFAEVVRDQKPAGDAGDGD